MATVVYKHIASLLSEHSGQSYSRTLHWLRCKLGGLGPRTIVFILLLRSQQWA